MRRLWHLGMKSAIRYALSSSKSQSTTPSAARCLVGKFDSNESNPFRAYPVTGGITFTYGGLNISDNGSVLNEDKNPIRGLYACGELVGGVFFNGYPGGSGFTLELVFGRIAGLGASHYSYQRHQIK